VSAKEEHIERILEIEREAISPPWSREALFDEMNRDDSYFAAALDKDGENFDICCQKNRPHCAVLAFVVVRQVGDDGELLQIAVDKAARRCGVGDLLIAHILSHAEKSGFKSVFLEVRSSNTAAVKLYEKHGFRAVRIRKSYYDKPVEDALVMAKTL